MPDWVIAFLGIAFGVLLKTGAEIWTGAVQSKWQREQMFYEQRMEAYKAFLCYIGYQSTAIELMEFEFSDWVRDLKGDVISRADWLKILKTMDEFYVNGLKEHAKVIWVFGFIDEGLVERYENANELFANLRKFDSPPSKKERAIEIRDSLRLVLRRWDELQEEACYQVSRTLESADVKKSRRRG